MEVRSILDCEISPQLKSIPGGVEVNSFGGELENFELKLNQTLVAHGISLGDVFQALEKTPPRSAVATSRAPDSKE